MLQLDDVRKAYGTFVAVDGLTLRIPESTVFGLLGPNGAGKTTLLRMVMGLLPVSSGRIQLFGNYSPLDPEVRTRLGYMPQKLAIYPGLSIRENVQFFGRLYGVFGDELEKRTDEVLDMVELRAREQDLVAHLSGGMARRTMLATALVHRPRLLILDEPTAGVDPVLRLKFWAWFESLVRQGMSIIVTTHHISEARRCQRVVFLRSGRLLKEGTPEELMDTYEVDDLEAAFVAATRNDDGDNGRVP